MDQIALGWGWLDQQFDWDGELWSLDKYQLNSNGVGTGNYG